MRRTAISLHVAASPVNRVTKINMEMFVKKILSRQIF